jgi:hypothetical protein
MTNADCRRSYPTGAALNLAALKLPTTEVDSENRTIG